jgi:hypothetical protein
MQWTTTPPSGARATALKLAAAFAWNRSRKRR